MLYTKIMIEMLTLLGDAVAWPYVHLLGYCVIVINV